MSREVQIPVTEIEQGDKYTDGGGWTALRAAQWTGGKVEVEVQYSDGGIGARRWDNPTHEIVVSRG